MLILASSVEGDRGSGVVPIGDGRGRVKLRSPSRASWSKHTIHMRVYRCSYLSSRPLCQPLTLPVAPVWSVRSSLDVASLETPRTLNMKGTVKMRMMAIWTGNTFRQEQKDVRPAISRGSSKGDPQMGTEGVAKLPIIAHPTAAFAPPLARFW